MKIIIMLMKMKILTVGGYKNEDDNNNEKETEIKNAEEAKFDLANNFLNNLGVMANKKGRRKKKFSIIKIYSIKKILIILILFFLLFMVKWLKTNIIKCLR